MSAEEYYKEFYKKWYKENHKVIIGGRNTGKIAKTYYEFAEAYKNHCVNAISDEEIDNLSGGMTLWAIGAKYLKKLLLKP